MSEPKFKIGDWVQGTEDTVEYYRKLLGGDTAEVLNGPLLVNGVELDMDDDPDMNLYLFNELMFALYEFELEVAS